MDKKYQQPYSSKSPATDSKKCQDVNAKQFPKSSRKREQTRTGNFSKNDQPRRSNTQKTKAFDKRPKPKGQYHGCPKEESKVVETEAELGSVMVKGSKKQNNNVNHLLNFKLAPRNVQGGLGGYSSHHNNRSHTYVQRKKYDKDQFLQANCQFVVTASGDYSQYLINEGNNVDKLIDWELIQQIRVPSSENLSCPICLYPPVAAKMTRCGHVYCWPCILGYLSLFKEAGPDCPVCHDSVYKSGLKSVKIIIDENTMNVGEEITLRLMRRERKSLIAVPVCDTETPAPTHFLDISNESYQQAHSKLLLAQKKDIEEIVNLEKIELEDGYLLEKNLYPDSHTIPFYEQALKELEERKNFWNVFYQNDNKLSQLQIDEKSDYNTRENACGVDSEFEEEENYLSDDKNILSEPQKFFYFYQADSGQNIYLFPMNVKMLEMQYGSLEKSPLIISGTLLERQVYSLNEEKRESLRFLSHLPVTSQYELVEIDLRSFVSDDVLKSFQGQINNYQFKRKKRERQERRREKKIDIEQNKLMGKYPSPTISIDSRKHFPQFQPESELDDSYNSSSPVGSIVSSLASSPATNVTFDELVAAGGELNNTWPSSSNQSRSSFAQMVQSNNLRKSVGWPSLNTSSRKAIEEAAASAAAKASSSTTEPAVDPEMEEYMAPIYKPNLGDAVARAFQHKELLSQETSGCNDNVAAGKKKKKKPKATLLFATSMARAS